MAHKLAIVGFGGMGTWHYENVSKRVDEVEVKGVYDVRQEPMDTAASLGLKTYESLDAVLNDPEIDIVTIATPNNFHKDIAIKAMRAGKNVISEKPVTIVSSELEEIMAVAKETGKLFSVHQNRRWDKDYLIIKKILSDKTIGEPYYIESRVQGSRGPLHGWRGYKVNGGGMVLDWGIHLLDQMLDMIDSKVVDIDAHLFSIHTPEVDDNFKTMIKFENGVSYLVEVATNCFINQPRWHVCCKEGTAVVENWDCDGKIIKLANNDELAWEDVIVYTSAGPTRTMAPRPEETTEQLELPEVEADWTNFYRNIAAVLDGKAELIVKPEQCLRVMKVVDAIFESHEKGHSISVNI